VHADQLRAVADQAERAVEVVPGRGFGRVADDDGRGARVALRGFVIAEECWPANSDRASSDVRT
jgi:hypothetical protein